MFKYLDRSNITDLLRPPVGYKLTSCIGTTYSLDFITLTASLLALADFDIKESLSNIPPAEYLQVINKLEGKLSLYCNKGSINLPNDACKNELFVLYDKFITEIYIPDASFHPKVWLIKYSSINQDDHIYRLICGSRNLTIGTNWEAVVSIDGIPTNKETIIGKNINDFFRGFLIKNDMDRYRIMLNEIRNIEFYTNNYEYNFLFNCKNKQMLVNEFENKSESMMIVSPFIRSSFIKHILKNTSRIIILSTQRELDVINKKESELIKDLMSNHDLYVIEEYENNEDDRYGLHAKIYFLNTKKDNMLLIGSPNASYNGWQNNIEALISINNLMGYKDFYNQFIYDKEMKQLYPWIRKYVPSSNDLDLDNSIKISEIISKTQAYINSMNIIANYSENKIVLRLEVNENQLIDENIKIYFALYAKPDKYYSLEELIKVVCVNNIDLEDLSEFIIVKIKYADIKEKTYIVKAVTNYAKEFKNRDQIIFNKYINDDTFQHFIFSIIYSGAKYYSAIDKIKKRKSSNNRPFTVMQNISIEEIMKTCVNSKDKVNEIDSFLAKYSNVSKEFRSFWTEFKKAIEACQS